MNLRDESISEFTRLIASTAPAPGGGGASAAVGAMAVALGNMVGTFTVGKKKYADVEDDIQKLMAQCENIRMSLLELIDEDAENFIPLSKAYGIPKDAPGRDEELERCLRLAAEAPRKILILCCEVLDILDQFAHKGSKLMISDAATGTAFCKAALQGAVVNIKVNTKLMKDRAYAKSINESVETMFTLACEKADRIFNFVYEQL